MDLSGGAGLTMLGEQTAALACMAHLVALCRLACARLSSNRAAARMLTGMPPDRTAAGS